MENLINYLLKIQGFDNIVVNIELFKKIHFCFFGKLDFRFEENSEYYLNINQEIENINYILRLSDSSNFLESLLNSIANIYMLQPFYDGNRRTCGAFLELILKLKTQKYLKFNYMDGFNLVPTFYHLNDEIPRENIRKLKQLIF